MQPHDSSDQRPEEKPADGRRDAERGSVQDALRVALAAVLDVGNRPVRVAEPGKPCDMSATISGNGGASA